MTIATKYIVIELAWSTKKGADLASLKVPFGSSIRDIMPELVRACGISILDFAAYGIYSKKVNLDYILQSHDRLELYLPLLQNPRVLRKVKVNKLKRKD